MSSLLPKHEHSIESQVDSHIVDNPKEKDILLCAASSSEEVEETELIIPPDGGWGWVVVFASFMCNMVVDGIIFSFGAFLSPIANTFDVSEAHVALVGSLMSGFYLIAGPFASALANRYGFRLVAISGSILASIAFALSYFATSVQYLCVTFGLLGGVGFGFIYVPSVITVGFYFEKWRALATGIGVCGSGIGTFMFAPISSTMIRTMGWRSALLCQGGIVITCVVFGSLYRPLKSTKIKEMQTNSNLLKTSNKMSSLTKLKIEKALETISKNNTTLYDHRTSIGRLLGVNNNADYPRIADVYHTISVPQTRNYLDVSDCQKRLSVPFIRNDEKPQFRGVTCEVNRPMYRDDIFFNASLSRLPQYTSQTCLRYNLSVTRLPTKNDIDEETKQNCKLFPEAVKRTLATMLDVSLLKSPSFLLLAFGGFLTMMGFYVPFMYLTDRAKINGMDEKKAIILISSIGIANTIGRVLCGVLSSFPGVNALFVTNTALTIGGIATMASGWSIKEEYQFAYTVVFGLSISCFASLRSIIVVDLMGLDKLTNAFGLLLLFQGVAATIGAPLAGVFKVWTGSYDASFYLSGGLILASAVMCYPLNWINKWELKKKKKNEII